jgi:hypothetical protein
VKICKELFIKAEQSREKEEEKEKHLLPDIQEVGAKRLKVVALVPGIFILSELGEFQPEPLSRHMAISLSNP